MTPKEKGEKLFNKFIIIDDLSDSTGNSLYFNAHAKQCALIAVDEILDMVKHTPIEFIETDYWQEVKQEIERL